MGRYDVKKERNHAAVNVRGSFVFCSNIDRYENVV